LSGFIIQTDGLIERAVRCDARVAQADKSRTKRMTNKEMLDLCDCSGDEDVSVRVPVKDLRRLVADSDALRTLVDTLHSAPGDFTVVSGLSLLA
jgi:hypothetical protein